MNPSPPASDAFDRLNRIHGASVLVKSAQDRRDPPIALRGSIDTKSTPHTVKVILEFPDMGVAPAHQGIVTLSAAGVEQLLQSECGGMYEITVPESLDAAPSPAPRRSSA